jgi:hypothetical protein
MEYKGSGFVLQAINTHAQVPAAAATMTMIDLFEYKYYIILPSRLVEAIFLDLVFDKNERLSIRQKKKDINPVIKGGRDQWG